MIFSTAESLAGGRAIKALRWTGIAGRGDMRARLTSFGAKPAAGNGALCRKSSDENRGELHLYHFYFISGIADTSYISGGFESLGDLILPDSV